MWCVGGFLLATFLPRFTALHFQPGNDTTIKSYLAGRLQQLLSSEERLSCALQKAEASAAEEQAGRHRACEELALLQQTLDQRLREMESTHASELAARREEAAREKEDALGR